VSVLLLYINYHTNFAILSLYTELIVSDTLSINVVFTKKADVPTSEEELLNASSPETVIYTLDASRRSHEIELAFDNYDVLGQVITEQGLVNTLTVKRVVLPESWKSVDLIQRWHRLSWEQQKAAYGELAFWKDFPHLTRETPSPGWPAGSFDFPVDPPNLTDSLTAPAVAYVDQNQRNIDVECDNPTVGDVEIVVRKMGHPSNNSRAGTDWLHWRNMDQGEQLIPWNATGNFEIDTHALIDRKQVPLVPNRPFTPTNKDVFLFQIKEGIPATSAYWVDDDLWLYIYDTAPESLLNTIRVRVAGIDVILPIENKKELNLLVGQVKSSSIVDVHIEYRHQTKRDGSVYLGEHYLRTQRPMVHGEDSTFLRLDEVDDIQNEDYIEITVMNPSNSSWEGRLWLVAERPNFFKVDTKPEAPWFVGVRDQKIISRLHVTKRLEGREIYLGSFVMNPLYDASSQITGMVEESVFEYIETIEDGYRFKFYPYKGSLAIDNPRPSDGKSETYEFRISEWTLGVEHGLITDQNLAWMVPATQNSPRFRYDTWDEEHPVKRWLNQSPIDPKSDSVSRLSNLAKSSHAMMIDTSDKEGPLQSPNRGNPRIIGIPRWCSYYDLMVQTQYVGFWHAYDFTFNLGSLPNGARNLRIMATYWYDEKTTELIQLGAGDSQTASVSPAVTITKPVGGFSAETGKPLLSVMVSQFKHVFGNHHVVDFVSAQLLYNYVLGIQLAGAQERAETISLTTGNLDNSQYASASSITEHIATLAAISITSDQQISTTMYVKYNALYTNADGEDVEIELSKLINPDGELGLIRCNWDVLEVETDTAFSNSGQENQSENAIRSSSTALGTIQGPVNLNEVPVSQLPLG